MTATALASELHMPLFTVLIDGLMTKFMGETAAKLRLIFAAMEETRGVYLFDAIGARRGERNDVGEIRRVLNSFLQFLEQDESGSLIIAATNHPELLDPALIVASTT
jgi:SpoVK/Ycf46/Vps4 family AAA+-type ATPase